MKVTLGPHAEIDTLTQEELRAVLDEYINRTVIPNEEPSRDFQTISLNASGNTLINNNSDVAVYTPKQGFAFRLHLLSVSCDGFTAGAPTSAVGITIKAGGRLVGVQANPSIPGVFTWGSKEAPNVVGAEPITIMVESGPANGVLSIFAAGYMKRFGA
jgi:hypothetical protein